MFVISTKFPNIFCETNHFLRHRFASSVTFSNSGLRCLGLGDCDDVIGLSVVYIIWLGEAVPPGLVGGNGSEFRKVLTGLLWGRSLVCQLNGPGSILAVPFKSAITSVKPINHHHSIVIYMLMYFSPFLILWVLLWLISLTSAFLPLIFNTSVHPLLRLVVW